MYKAPLAAAVQPMRDLGACRDEITGHNTGISLLLLTSTWDFLSPPMERRDTVLDQWLNVPVHGRTILLYILKVP